MPLGDYMSLRDMFDGGGAGMSGPEFQGGGLLSAIANSMFSPLGSQGVPDAVQATRPMARPTARPMSPPVVASSGPQAQSTPPHTAFRGYQGSFPALAGNPAPYADPADPRNGHMMQATPGQKRYGGRGPVGMPINPITSMSPEEVQLVEYLRSRGLWDR